MKLVTGAMLMAFGSAHAMAAQTSVKEILQKPLIIGASVSAGYGTPSPGKRLALRYTTDANVRTIAQNGKPGKEVLRSISAKSLEDRTAIIGLDLFFWDSTHASAKVSIEALRSLVALAKKQNLPLVLGEIPGLLPSHQPSREALNLEMAQACRTYDRCVLLPLDEILHKVIADGSLEYKGKHYGLMDLLPDGLHLGPVAADYLADRILEALEKVPSAAQEKSPSVSGVS